jgi:hypothetical protein
VSAGTTSETGFMPLQLTRVRSLYCYYRPGRRGDRRLSRVLEPEGGVAVVHFVVLGTHWVSCSRSGQLMSQLLLASSSMGAIRMKAGPDNSDRSLSWMGEDCRIWVRGLPSWGSVRHFRRRASSLPGPGAAWGADASGAP